MRGSQSFSISPSHSLREQVTVVQYSFAGKNALVTGSSKGIGRAVAVSLAKGGANVVVNCSGSRAQAEDVAAEIRSLGRKSYVAVCDVSDQSAVEAMVAKVVAEFGSLDLFVSNAVYSDRELMVNAKMDGFRRTIEVSMWGRCTACVLQLSRC